MARLGCLGASMLLLIVATGCSSLNRQISNLVFPPHWDSNEREGEASVIHLTFSNPDPGPPFPREPEPEVAAALAPVVIGALIKGIESFLQSEAKLYTASYSATIASDIFYDSFQEDGEITFRESTSSEESSAARTRRWSCASSWTRPGPTPRSSSS